MDPNPVPSPTRDTDWIDELTDHPTYTHEAISPGMSDTQVQDQLIPRQSGLSRNQQQVELDLNATANGSTESVGRNVETGGTQNGQPKSGGDNSGGRRSTSAFDRLGPGSPGPNLFGGIGSYETQIIQELRHRMQAMEVEVKELRKENVELKNATKDLRSRQHSPHRRRSRSKYRTPTRRREHTPPCGRTSPRRRRHPSSSDNHESSSDESREPRRRQYGRYKKMRGRERTPPVDGHTPFSNQIQRI
ncbi:hypothetical protein PIB30_022807 [Stylosanthes scabra]|uniref:Uncharacterized protein n=1 Tax=Stylosanthes scabra TaxID=79078 RepID=A0ABU6UCK2_9FABA|nr:hypothetical protein [Stylosanthes scabra]